MTVFLAGAEASRFASAETCWNTIRSIATKEATRIHRVTQM